MPLFSKEYRVTWIDYKNNTKAIQFDVRFIFVVLSDLSIRSAGQDIKLGLPDLLSAW